MLTAAPSVLPLALMTAILSLNRVAAGFNETAALTRTKQAGKEISRAFRHPYQAEPRYISDSDIWEYQKYHQFGGYKAPRPKMPGLGDLLSLLAPLAAIPLIGGAALTTFSTLFGGGLGTLGGLNLFGGKRRRRDTAVHLLEYPVTVLDSRINAKGPPLAGPSREAVDLDIIQKYLNKVRPNGGYNDEIIATYLSCSGMLDINNHCLERLVCQFSTPSGGMSELEKDVTSLIIYSIMKNEHIAADFKTRLRRASFFGREYHTQCGMYTCSKLENRAASTISRETRRALLGVGTG